MRVVAATVIAQRTRAAKKTDMSVPISRGMRSLCSETACWRMSMESLSASLTGALSVSDVVHSCAIHVRSVVFNAAKAWAVATFSEKIHDSHATASKARIGVTCTSFATDSMRLVAGASSRRCSRLEVVDEDMYCVEVLWRL